MTRAQLETLIDSAIDTLDILDGDPDLEAEFDFGADDVGEREGDTFMGAAA
jgi:hypothetical protein